MIESPIEAMLVGNGGAAEALGTTTDATTTRLRRNALRAMKFFCRSAAILHRTCSAGRCWGLRSGGKPLGPVALDQGVDLICRT